MATVAVPSWKMIFFSFVCNTSWKISASKPYVHVTHSSDDVRHRFWWCVLMWGQFSVSKSLLLFSLSVTVHSYYRKDVPSRKVLGSERKRCTRVPWHGSAHLSSNMQMCFCRSVFFHRNCVLSVPSVRQHQSFFFIPSKCNLFCLIQKKRL